MIIIGKFDCGCPATEEDGDGNYVALKTQDIDRDGLKNVIRYANYCNDCYKQAVECGCVCSND